MRGPLALTVDDGNGARHVTAQTRGLRFKRSAYGGDVDLSCSLTLPRGFFTDLSANDPVTLYDGRTGGFVFRGNANQPGGSAGPRGETYDLQAFGGAARLQSVSKPSAYVLALDEGWKKTDSTKGAQVGQEEKGDSTPTLEVSWAKLFELEGGDQGEFGNRVMAQNGLKLGRIRAQWDAGRTDSDVVLRLMTGTDMGSLSSADSATASTGGGTLAAYLGGGGISFGDDVAALRARYTGATLDVHKNGSTDKVEGGIPDKSYWFRFWDVIVRQALKDKTGANITAGYSANTVTADQVIADMIGRNMIPGLDPSKVTIGAFSYALDALTYLDGITAGDMLEALRVFEPNLTWQVYGDEGNFDVWPSDPRYVISSRDGGVSHPGEDGASLANYVLVSWNDRRGRARTTVVETTVEGLDYTQQIDPISLPDGVGSDANATRAGTKALELHNSPPKAGSAVVRRPILDLWTGAMVLPHEIMPGCMVLEQETGDRFQLTEVDYSDDDCAAVLTLGEPVRPIEAVIARLERKQRRRKG